MRLPENFLAPEAASAEWGVTRQWIYMCFRDGRFHDYEVWETPHAIYYSREGLHRVLGPPDPNRVAPNSGPRKKRPPADEQN